MKKSKIYTALLVFVTACFVFIQQHDAEAQLFKRGQPLLRRDKNAKDAPTAVIGEPFGVGSVSFDLPGDVELSVFTHREFTLTEKNGRVFYSVYDHEPVKNALRDVLNLKQGLLGKPFKVTVYFLFKGNEPLDLTLYTPEPQAITINPVSTATLHQTLLNNWWEEYLKTTRQSFANSEYPQMMDMYLVVMLGQRLGLKIPEHLEGLKLFDFSKGLDSSLGLLLGAESIRLAMQKETLLAADQNNRVANQPLPAAVQPPPVEYAEPAANVQIEPIADHVPHECFYVRFGSFNNFQWLRDSINEWGGDLRNLMAFRGIDYELNGRMEKQLAIRESALARVLGPAVIADVAMIGQDTFLREGAAVGMLFHANNNFGLSTDIKGHRSQALKDNPTAREEIIDIAGHKVSFIATPDFVVRSFYAVDGDFHLVTTSRRIVERFYEAGAGKDSLASSKEFRSTRARMPVSREDTIFAYFSDAFFRNLTGPAFRIEMTRRMNAVAEMDNWRLAVLAAKSEHLQDQSLASLVQGGFLPASYGKRADGSQLQIEGDKITDSLRGGIGSMIPVGDVNIESATADEVKAYQDFAHDYTELWTRMDPTVVGLKRFAVADQTQNTSGNDNANTALNTGFRERFVLDLLISPIPKKQYGMLEQFLAEPTTQRSTPRKEDLFSLEFVGRYPQSAPANHYLIGIRDSDLELQKLGNGYVLPRDESKINAYAAAWPQPALLSFLGFRTDARYDAQGIASADNKTWQFSNGNLSAISKQPNLLVDVANNFQLVESERTTQLRLHISELTQNKWNNFANALSYYRARQISAGNLHMLHLMSSQFGVAPEKAKEFAETILQAKLLDPLGGKYELRQEKNAWPMWASTAWKPETDRLTLPTPAEYVSPPTKWFRGLDAEISILPTEFIGRIELEMQHAAKQNTPAATEAPTPQLPLFSWPNFKSAQPSPTKENSVKPDTPPKNIEELPLPNNTEKRPTHEPPPVPRPDPGK